MATAVKELWLVSTDSSARRALTLSWLGWMFDGYPRRRNASGIAD
jgi:hypothetical protein